MGIQVTLVSPNLDYLDGALIPDKARVDFDFLILYDYSTFEGYLLDVRMGKGF